MTRRSYTYYGNWASIIKVLLTGPASLRELEDKTGVHYETLRPLMKALHAEGVVFVAQWKIDGMGRASIACYQLGFGCDAPKRKPKTPAQRTMKYKNKKLAAKEEPLGQTNTPLITNNTIDLALRGWSARPQEMPCTPHTTHSPQ